MGDADCDVGKPRGARGRIGLDMDFPEKAIIGVLGDVGVLKVPAGVSVRAVGDVDRIQKQRTISELAAERRAGQTVLVASYDEELLAEVCDELWWIADGKV